MSAVRRLVRGLALCTAGAGGCSNFAMENDFGLSVRTMDLGDMAFDHYLATIPVGSKGLRSSEHGYVAFTFGWHGISADSLVSGGLNDAGLSCDLQTLLGSEYPARNASLDNVAVEQLCRWALEGHGSVPELKEGLRGFNFVAGLATKAIGGIHYALRDAQGRGLVVEFMGGSMQVYGDDNDQGKTGFGVMTNEPAFPWQLKAVRHLQWKQGLARPSVAMPGSWYPDERFQRIHLVKSGMPKPGSYQEAVMQAVHTLNTITVPMGQQIGTDSGKSSGEGSGDHTQWGVIYDHAQRILYWRSSVNQNLQRLRLADAALAAGGKRRHLAVQSPLLPWYSDASARLAPASPQAEPQVAELVL